jgi:hypothetical protein
MNTSANTVAHSMLAQTRRKPSDMCEYHHHFHHSLSSDRSTPSDILIPDGIIDLSSCVKPLLCVTRKGRPLRSSDAYSIAELLGRVRSAITTEGGCEVTLAVFEAMLLGQMIHVPKDACLDEILMVLFKREVILEVIDQWSATPYVMGLNKEMLPVFSSHKVFARSMPITQKNLRGFIQRHFIDTLKYLVADDDSLPWETDSADEIQPEPPTVRLNLSDIDESDLISDQFNGFDEFDEFFQRDVVDPYIEGASLEELGFQEVEEDEDD